MFKIEKNVPAPGHHSVKYPFAQMEIGDSFLARGVPQERVRAAASYSGTRHGRRYTVRMDGAHPRVWRVE